MTGIQPGVVWFGRPDLGRRPRLAKRLLAALHCSAEDRGVEAHTPTDTGLVVRREMRRDTVMELSGLPDGCHEVNGPATLLAK